VLTDVTHMCSEAYLKGSQASPTYWQTMMGGRRKIEAQNKNAQDY